MLIEYFSFERIRWEIFVLGLLYNRRQINGSERTHFAILSCKFILPHKKCIYIERFLQPLSSKSSIKMLKKTPGIF